VLATLLRAAFGPQPDTLEGHLASDPVGTLVIEHGDQPVGTVRLSREDGVGAVYGFAVDPTWQGRGIGRDVLGRVCRQLRHEGMERVQLEVAVNNDRALGLYTSLGFTRAHTEDYYELALGPGSTA
jgi:ribosomal protein S18 acetylase RimI-like enzyme